MHVLIIIFVFGIAASYQVYTGAWGEHSGTIHCSLGEVVHYELGEEPEPRREALMFDKPTRGTSVEKFKEMVFNHLKVENICLSTVIKSLIKLNL